MYSKYPTRFDSNSNWKRILFRGGKKSQTAEFQELQQLSNHSQGQLFYSLYGPYSVVKGLKVKILSLAPTYQIEVEEGQIFVSNSVGSHFIDIKSFTLSLPISGRSIVSVKPNFKVQGDENLNLRDYISGGYFSGSRGAHRLIVDYEIRVNEDGYPLFILDGQGSTKMPYIYYYYDNYFTTQYKDYLVAPPLRSKLELYTYEEYGDYIVRGLDCNISRDNYLVVSPGVAYINGKKVEVGYGFTYELSLTSTLQDDDVFSLYLSDKGLFDLIQYKSYAIRNVPSVLKIADIHVDESKYKITCTQNRAISNNELLTIIDLVENNEELLLAQQLRRQEIDDSYFNDINLAGTLVESFSNNNNSSLFHPLYDAVIEGGALRMGNTKRSLRLSSLSISATNLARQTITENTSYLSPSYSEFTLIDQSRASEFVTIRNIAGPSVQIYPPYSIPDQDNLRVETVNVKASGFNSNEDNISISFGNVGIFDFVVSNGTTLGSSAYSVKASSDGTVDISFLIPSNLETRSYPITLSNSRVSASAVYEFNGTVLPVDNSTTSTFTLNPLTLSPSSLAQTFYISTPVTITSVSLAIRDFNEILSDRSQVFTVYLVSSSETTPGGEVIARAAVAASSIVTSSNGSRFTKILFENPGVIPSVGYYAILISTPIPGLELFTATVNVADLNGGPISGNQPLTNGNLLLNNGGTWQSITNSDLTFKLHSAIISSPTSTVDLAITNAVDEISDVAISLVGKSSNLSYTEFRLKVGNNFTTLQAARNIGFSANTLIGRLQFTADSYLLPYIDTTASYVDTYSVNDSATWISKNYLYFTKYNAVELTLDYYSPEGSDISVLISSNKGQTWEGLSRVGNKDDSVIDGNIPLYRSKYIVENLTDTVQIRDINGTTNSYLRKEISVRIDMESRSESISPYVTQFTLKLY